MALLKKWHKQLRQNPWHINMFILFMTILVGWGCVITYTTFKLFSRRDYWNVVSQQFSRKNIKKPAKRGSILACDGRPLSISVPEYRLYLDYHVLAENKHDRDTLQYQRDSIYRADIDSIALGMAKIFPEHDARWFRNRLEEGRRRYENRITEKGEDNTNSCTWMIYDGLANHIQYRECLELPLFRERSAVSGFHSETIMKRMLPYGSLASRTIGSLYPETDSAKCGLELSFDSVLRGTPGLSHTVRVRNRNISVIDKEPINGCDLQSTIDIDLQDFADKTLRAKLKEETVNGEIGIAIVMEVKTGDVKAIVNLMRGQDGEYYEMKNHAVSDLMEPGSTFKTASMMVAMEDGYINENTTMDCMGGICNMYGRQMKDHNWNKGGYGTLTVSEILEQSSNIGVSRIIDKYYHNQPSKYVNGLLREGVGIPLNLPFVGKGEPRVPDPNSTYRYWSKTDLPWMSIGYVTMLPPISTLAFYNAIANNGTMVRPRFVRAELRDHKVVREHPVEVIKQEICSKSTLRQIQNCLEHVVSKGLGKKAGNGGKLFHVSGKTGTAQFATNGGYGSHKYMVSFCGYFPSEAPKYSCIVCIVKQGLPASGGGQCGPVFREISKYLMGQGDYRDPSEACDTTSTFHPTVKRDCTSEHSANNIMPNVIGMGAKDAIYALQKRGLRVHLVGNGAVIGQSIHAGNTVKRDEKVTITLKNKKK